MTHGSSDDGTVRKLDKKIAPDIAQLIITGGKSLIVLDGTVEHTRKPSCPRHGTAAIELQTSEGNVFDVHVLLNSVAAALASYASSTL